MGNEAEIFIIAILGGRRHLEGEEEDILLHDTSAQFLSLPFGG